MLTELQPPPPLPEKFDYNEIKKTIQPLSTILCNSIFLPA